MEKIYFGKCLFENVIIREFKRGYQDGYFITVLNPSNFENSIGLMVENLGGADLTKLQREQTLLTIQGDIIKNPKSGKTLFYITNLKKDTKLKNA